MEVKADAWEQFITEAVPDEKYRKALHAFFLRELALGVKAGAETTGLDEVDVIRIQIFRLQARLLSLKAERIANPPPPLNVFEP